MSLQDARDRAQEQMAARKRMGDYDRRTKLKPKGHEETMEEKQRRWFLRDAEQYLGQLRHALFREDWAASRQQCGEILDLIDRREGGRP